VKLSLDAKAIPPGSGRGNLSSRFVFAGVIVALVIGVAVYLLSGSRKGSVEYHKARFVRVVDRPSNRWVARYAPRFLANAYFQRQDGEAQFHLQALLDLGYLEERVFSLSNHLSPGSRDLDGFRSRVYQLTDQMPSLTSDFDHIIDVATNSVTVLGRREKMSEWAKVIREVDVPKRK